MYYNEEAYLEKVKVIMSTIIIAIKDIHMTGIVHRDLKPTNICIDKNFVPYIIDLDYQNKLL